MGFDVGMNLNKSQWMKLSRTGLVLGLTAMLASCGSLMSSDNELEASSAATPAQTGPTFDLSVLSTPAFCPDIQELSGTTILTQFPRRAEKTPENLSYQAIITDSARTCKKSGDNSVMKLGIAGNITPGPTWKGGEVLLPIRVAVQKNTADAETTIYSKLFNVPVTLGQGSPSATWAFVEENIVLPNERGQKVIFGFDEK